MGSHVSFHGLLESPWEARSQEGSLTAGSLYSARVCGDERKENGTERGDGCSAETPLCSPVFSGAQRLWAREMKQAVTQALTELQSIFKEHGSVPISQSYRTPNGGDTKVPQVKSLWPLNCTETNLTLNIKLRHDLGICFFLKESKVHNHLKARCKVT